MVLSDILMVLTIFSLSTEDAVGDVTGAEQAPGAHSPPPQTTQATQRNT